jgi:disulfide bond formation protein DsbB
LIVRLNALTRTHFILAAAGGSLALLAGAFMFQALGYAPCQMCLWQRWPHAAAVVLGIVALAGIAPRVMSALGAFAAFATAVIGGFHAGVEQGWWEGPTACSGGGDSGLSTLSGADLISTAIQDSVVMCNEIAWSLMGVSMAAWNMMFSLVFVALWLRAAWMAD